MVSWYGGEAQLRAYSPDTIDTMLLHSGADENEPPPILGNWRNVNLVVLAWLALLIFLFYKFTEYFS